MSKDRNKPSSSSSSSSTFSPAGKSKNKSKNAGAADDDLTSLGIGTVAIGATEFEESLMHNFDKRMKREKERELSSINSQIEQVQRMINNCGRVGFGNKTRFNTDLQRHVRQDLQKYKNKLAALQDKKKVVEMRLDAINSSMEIEMEKDKDSDSEYDRIKRRRGATTTTSTRRHVQIRQQRSGTVDNEGKSSPSDLAFPRKHGGGDAEVEEGEIIDVEGDIDVDSSPPKKRVVTELARFLKEKEDKWGQSFDSTMIAESTIIGEEKEGEMAAWARQMKGEKTNKNNSTSTSTFRTTAGGIGSMAGPLGRKKKHLAAHPHVGTGGTSIRDQLERVSMSGVASVTTVSGSKKRKKKHVRVHGRKEKDRKVKEKVSDELVIDVERLDDSDSDVDVDVEMDKDSTTAAKASSTRALRRLKRAQQTGVGNEEDEEAILQAVLAASRVREQPSHTHTVTVIESEVTGSDDDSEGEGEGEYVSTSVVVDELEEASESEGEYGLESVEVESDAERVVHETSVNDSNYQDDGVLSSYLQRLNEWRHDEVARRAVVAEEKEKEEEEKEEEENLHLDHMDHSHPFWPGEYNMRSGRFNRHGSSDDEIIDGGFRIPHTVFSELFPYQREAVQWLWKHHCQGTGCIIGDEMGLGKTIQIVAFLAGLQSSGTLGRSIVVCPATVLRQWIREFHKWWPPIRIVLLHDSGVLMRQGYDRTAVVDTVVTNGDILITTYESLRKSLSYLLQFHWDYLILDEGHKIRNPNTSVTLAVKRFNTPHRVILSGAPLQNNLNELWSLFDFVVPGKLGTLPVFQSQFSLPITIGGYSNASSVQVQTAYHCAVMLRDIITPFLLRRMKKDVDLQLPGKAEQVLFCELTDMQKNTYRHFLESKDLEAVLDGRRNMLYGIDVLRKICNHPDLLLREADPHDRPADYGKWDRSGKLIVADKLIEAWGREGHRALFFAQTRQMLDILEAYVQERGVKYLRMDGSTPISGRMTLIDRFNNDMSITVFLLSSRVGGLGTNLTGADRVLIYDPDWNPSTDIQARERAWRIGQVRPVTIYRMITSGTIEEKIYHRQIYKQFLTNKILKDPRQRRFFTPHDLKDLFILDTPTHTVQVQGEGEFRDRRYNPHSTHRSSTSTPKGKAKGKGKATRTSIMFSESETHLTGSSSTEPHSHSHPSELEATTTTATTATTVRTEKYGGESVQVHDESILSSLLGGSSVGLTSIMHHDKIIDSANPDHAIVEKEAKEIARKAIAELNRSRRARSRVGINVPTWTGASGEAGGPSLGASVAGTAKRRFGGVNGDGSATAPSSQMLLKRLKGKNRKEGGEGEGEEQWPWQVRLTNDMHDYFVHHESHCASTSELITHFKRRLTGAEQNFAFREILREMAVFKDQKWHMTDEFLH